MMLNSQLTLFYQRSDRAMAIARLILCGLLETLAARAVRLRPRIIVRPAYEEMGWDVELQWQNDSGSLGFFYAQRFACEEDLEWVRTQPALANRFVYAALSQIKAHSSTTEEPMPAEDIDIAHVHRVAPYAAVVSGLILSQVLDRWGERSVKLCPHITFLPQYELEAWTIHLQWVNPEDGQEGQQYTFTRAFNCFELEQPNFHRSIADRFVKDLFSRIEELPANAQP